MWITRLLLVSVALSFGGCNSLPVSRQRDAIGGASVRETQKLSVHPSHMFFKSPTSRGQTAIVEGDNPYGFYDSCNVIARIHTKPHHPKPKGAAYRINPVASGSCYITFRDEYKNSVNLYVTIGS